MKIIGGMFGIEGPASERTRPPVRHPDFLSRPHLLLASARSAFTALHRTLRPPTVWLPSFLCGILVRAFADAGARIRFYEIDQGLAIARDDWMDKITDGDLVVFIDFFGFNQWEQFGAEARKRGAWVVEDASHALLNENFCASSHYLILNPRKFAGVPDGGILVAPAGARLPDIPLPLPPEAWHRDAVAASELRAEFDRHGGSRAWFPLFQKTEIEAPLQPCRMSELSSRLTAEVVDWPAHARRRRDNYLALARDLADIALFPELPNETVPMGFPIRVQERDRIRTMLFAQEIYPPVHWPIAGFVPDEYEASHHLARTIMTLPCDHRYDGTDMARISTLLRDAQVEPAEGHR